MTNESLLVFTALADITLVFIAARAGGKRLFGTIVINLLLITIFGAKLINVFGFVTNVGNVFYACVFLATHFLLERQKKDEAYQSLYFGASFIIFFIVFSQLALSFISTTPGSVMDMSMQYVFTLSLRVAAGSILAYIFAQYVNIKLYIWLKEKKQGSLWLCSNGANIVSQLVDSCLFFSIAFIDLPGDALIQAILAGWIIKTLVVLLGTPFLYIDRYFLQHK